MKLSPILPAIACIALLAPVAVASDRFFFDSFGISPNCRYRIDAKSPDNEPGNRRPFAANFTYTLTDTTAQKILWQRKQPMTRQKGIPYPFAAEGSPLQVFVNDEGLVAARLSEDTLLFLEPTDGRKRGEAEILKAFPQTQQDQFVAQTSAGLMWAQNSDWFFLSVPAADNQPPSTYFVIRPFWNHRLIIDAATAKHVDLGSHASAASAEAFASPAEPIRRILTRTIAEETRRAIASVAAAPENLTTRQSSDVGSEIDTALHMITSRKLTDAVAELSSLDERIDHTDVSLHQLRVRVRETLRLLGKPPKPGYVVQLYPRFWTANSLRADMEHPCRATVPTEQRIANAPKITVGMSVTEFTDLIGCPDAEVRDGVLAFDYDIDDPKPYTLRVFVTNDLHSIQSIKTITPFAFLHDPARQRAR